MMMNFEKRDIETAATIIRSIMHDDVSYIGRLTGLTKAERQNRVNDFFKNTFDTFEAEVRALANGPKENDDEND
jgi:hypothetical protein